MKISRDVNGNKTLVIQKHDVDPYDQHGHKGFNIQTNQNLPSTHKNGIHFETKGEVFDFISEHGTKRQKHLVGANVDLNLQNLQNGSVGWQQCFKALNDSDIDQLVEIIGGQRHTKNRVRSVLTYDFSTANFWGVSDRFMYDHKTGKWSYCAGQDYTYEMKNVRNALIK